MTTHKEIFEQDMMEALDVIDSVSEEHFKKIWNSAQENYKKEVREVLEKHAKRPRAECQCCRRQQENRAAEAKIKQIIEELGL